jgi:hypothetical protein
VPPTQPQVTVPPTAIVSTAAFWVPLRALLKKILPTCTEAVVGIGGAGTALSLKVAGEPVSPAAVAVTVNVCSVAGAVTVTAEMPETSVGTEAEESVPAVVSHVTAMPAIPFPN